jgi:hypothetical protein
VAGDVAVRSSRAWTRRPSAGLAGIPRDGPHRTARSPEPPRRSGPPMAHLTEHTSRSRPGRTVAAGGPDPPDPPAPSVRAPAAARTGNAQRAERATSNERDVLGPRVLARNRRLSAPRVPPWPGTGANRHEE